VAFVRKRTIPTERPSLVGEVSANFLPIEGVAWSVQRIPTAVNLGFLDRSRYFSIQVAPQLSSRGWVNPVPDPLLLRIFDSSGNRTWDLWICRQDRWPLDHRGGHFKATRKDFGRCIYSTLVFKFWLPYMIHSHYFVDFATAEIRVPVWQKSIQGCRFPFIQLLFEMILTSLLVLRQENPPSFWTANYNIMRNINQESLSGVTPPL
jgi:hypothetical protein